MGLVQKKCTCLSLPTVTLRSKLTFLFLNETSNPQSLLLPSSLFLVGCSPWGREESDTTERLHFHFSLSCIGEGHGNPLQCSCLENPRDGGAWWAAVYGVAQSRTRLKQLSSSSSICQIETDIFSQETSGVINKREAPAGNTWYYNLAQSDTGNWPGLGSNSHHGGIQESTGVAEIPCQEKIQDEAPGGDMESENLFQQTEISSIIHHVPDTKEIT